MTDEDPRHSTMSFLWSTLSSLWTTLLSSLGLANKKGSLLLLGLDNAGKTTLLHKLASGEMRPFPPTDRPRQDGFTVGGIEFQAWDLGGHEAVRHLWEDYVSTEVSAVLFLIDASDKERLEESGYELDALIGEKLVEGLPVALLFNKTDLETAASDDEILAKIDYPHLQTIQGEEKLKYFRISVLTGAGYPDAFQWVGSFL